MICVVFLHPGNNKPGCKLLSRLTDKDKNKRTFNHHVFISVQGTNQKSK
jgi:hypothetical protein